MRKLAQLAAWLILLAPSWPVAAQTTNVPAPKQVLFVCSGNYYRSRFSEAFFNFKAHDAHLGWKAVSRGLRVLPDRSGISPLARVELAKRNVPEDLSKGDPQALTIGDLDQSDYVVLLDETEHRPMIAKRFGTMYASKIHYWHVPDVPKLDAAEGCRAMSRNIEKLIGELAGPGKKP